MSGGSEASQRAHYHFLLGEFCFLLLNLFLELLQLLLPLLEPLLAFLPLPQIPSDLFLQGCLLSEQLLLLPAVVFQILQWKTKARGRRSCEEEPAPKVWV